MGRKTCQARTGSRYRGRRLRNRRLFVLSSRDARNNVDAPQAALENSRSVVSYVNRLIFIAMIVSGCGSSGPGGAAGGTTGSAGTGGTDGVALPDDTPCDPSIGLASSVCFAGNWCSTQPPSRGRLAVWGSSPSDVWTGGAGSLVHWDGRAWSIVTSAAGTPGSAQNAWSISAISGSSATDVWAVGGDGYNGIILHWDGAVWTTIAKGPGWPIFSGVWSSGPSDAWAVGSDIRHWNGSAWSVAVSNVLLQDVWGTGANDVWAVGSTGAIRHWDGAVWSTVASGSTASFNAVWGSGPSDVWAVGASSQSAGTILHWNGSAWSATTGSIPGLRSVWGSGSDDVWAISNTPPRGAILHWNGSAWSAVASDTPILYGVWGSGRDDFWAVGSESEALCSAAITLHHGAAP